MRKASVIAAVAAAGLLGLGVLLAGTGCGDTQGTPGPAGSAAEGASQYANKDALSLQGAPAAMPAPADRSAQGNPAAGVATGGGGAAGGSSDTLPLPQLGDRKIVRTATLELSVEKVGSSVDQVQQIAAAAGGFVSSSSLNSESPQGQADGRQRQTASITIRVPAQAYASVMSQLRGIAKEVGAEKSDASEVTEEYTDLQARLRNLEATEGRYLELLAKAQSIQDILLVQDRLNSVRLEIERAQGRIKLLDDLTDLATVSIQLHLPAPASVPEETQANWAQQVWDDAWAASKDVMRVMATAGIIGGVVLAWILVPGGLLLAGWRIFGGRRQTKPAA